MANIINFILLIAVIVMTISFSLTVVQQIREIITKRKIKKELNKINDEIDKLLTKIFTEVTLDKLKKDTETKAKKSNKKED